MSGIILLCERQIVSFVRETSASLRLRLVPTRGGIKIAGALNATTCHEKHGAFILFAFVRRGEEREKVWTNVGSWHGQSLRVDARTHSGEKTKTIPSEFPSITATNLEGDVFGVPGREALVDVGANRSRHGLQHRFRGREHLVNLDGFLLLRMRQPRNRVTCGNVKSMNEARQLHRPVRMLLSLLLLVH